MKHIYSLVFFFILNGVTYAQEHLSLPTVSQREPLAAEWFPSTEHAFIWRNWTVLPKEEIARTLSATTKQVEKLAHDMGLKKQADINPVWRSPKGYITVLRRNWHLLPYEQLTLLINMTSAQLAWRLIDDDYLYTKLGATKPLCKPLRYHKPTKEENKKARHICSWLKELSPYESNENPRFSFFREITSQETDTQPKVKSEEDRLNIVSSYCAEFGDPLLDSTCSSFPHILLQRLASKGINGIWFHASLQTLIPSDSLFPGSTQWDERLKNLQKLIDRTAKYGIRIYLYANEPRATQASYFNTAERQSVAGVKERQLQAFCTSDSRTINWLRDSWAFVFSHVHGLGGVFTITASENLTSCASHGGQKNCPRCAGREPADIIAEVNNTIVQGVKQGDSHAKVIVWDWGWSTPMAEAIIPQLDKRCSFMSVSEWSLPIERGGVQTTVGEYAVSAVGPGPRARHHWEIARRCGLPVMAKIQVNTSWELGCVPAIPVMNLIATHARRLAREKMNGIMFCWSLGGYPSDNMSIFRETLEDTTKSLLQFAEKRYGATAAPMVCEAWEKFSKAFSHFPYHIRTLYKGPQHSAPANPFYINPTLWHATMVGIPYDDIESWRGPYPAKTYIKLMREVAYGFDDGIRSLQDAQRTTTRGEAQLSIDILRAKAIQLIYKSVANQAEFTYHRNLWLTQKDSATSDDHLRIMLSCVDSELDIVCELLPIVQADPTLGYESSNQYYFLPQDLREKYINLRFVEQELRKLYKQKGIR